MSESFYKYLVDELIADYFKTNNPGSAGFKYFYVLLEKAEHRDGLFKAISQSVSADTIQIKGIYENRQDWMDEDELDTICFQPNPNGAKIIVANESCVTNGYLTTLRNAVVLPDTDYSEYALFNILSNDKLESITSAGINLLEKGGPLHQDAIYRNVIEKLKTLSIRDYDKVCLTKYAEKIKLRIEQNEADLFMFEDLLSVLLQSPVDLTGKYQKFGCFPDKYCTESSLVKITTKEMEGRLKENATLFSQMDAILRSYSTEVETELKKIYDDTLSKKVANGDVDWEQIDYSELKKSLDKKAERASYKFVSITTFDDHAIQFVHSELPKQNHKSKKVHVIVCDNTDHETSCIRITFNKPISDCTAIKVIGSKNKSATCNYKKHGTYVDIILNGNAIKCDIGEGSNKFIFYLTRIKSLSSTFDFIKPYFSINAKGNVIVKTPEDLMSVSLGTGSQNIDFTNSLGNLRWEDNYKLNIDLSNYSEDIDIPIEFDNKVVDFKIQMDEKRIVPVQPSVITTEVLSTKHSAELPGGNKVRVGSKEYNVKNDFFEYINLERKMSSDFVCCMRKTVSSFDEISWEEEKLSLPVSVKLCLNAIYAYFNEKQYVPSLCYIDEELSVLYKNYLNAVRDVITNIQPMQIMQEEEYALTKLGTIEDGEMVMFTPYHPLLVAYMLEFQNRYKGEQFDNSKALKLVTPFYLLPYISYNNKSRQPYCDSTTQDLRSWLFFETANKNQQVRTYNITTKMVASKLEEFKKHFSYLFQVKDSPIIMSVVGVYDDTDVVKGLIDYVKKEMKDSDTPIQRVEVHEYVRKITDETFFEKLNRLNSEELITKELAKVNVSLDMGNKDISPLQVIRQLFTRIDFFKHDINECHNEIEYCHITFYQMETDLNFSKSPSSILRSELSFNGLISIPSTCNSQGKTYTVGFGTKGFEQNLSKYGEIFPIAIDMNSLYANEKDHWASSYSPNTCYAKSYVFKDDKLLQSMYEKSNWVTFLNPEVDMDFFYRQQGLYVIHYTDQYTINAKYDSITVTKQTDQYGNMLSGFYDSMLVNSSQKEAFMRTMMNYFNSLNGDWLLSIINKTVFQVREKMSIVSASIAMQKFLSRGNDIMWIPISLEEILRVTGSIGLEQDSLFSKKTLGVKGKMSDDLLMVGLENDNGDITLYYYPVEVKASTCTNFQQIASEQVAQTYYVLQNTLIKDHGFISDVYKTFFASQLLTNTEKFRANQLIDDATFSAIDNCRFKLLNLDYKIANEMKKKEFGCAATIAFVGSSAPNASVDMVNNIPICHIEVSLNTCNACICDNDVSAINDLKQAPIIVSPEVSDYWDNQPCHNVSVLANNISNIDTDSRNSAAAQPQEVSASIEAGPNENAQEEEASNTSDEVSSTESHHETETLIVSQDGQQKETTAKPMRILLGHTKMSQSEVVFEPNNTHMVSHPNIGIIGTMGTGKTQLASSIIAQFAKERNNNVGGHPVGMLVFDYKGDYKGNEFLDKVGGTCYKYNYPFNPLKLVITPDVDGVNLPAITADKISDSFAKAYGLGLKQKSNIKQVILNTYSDAGITRKAETWSKPAPTMEQVIEKYFETYDANDKAYALFDKLRDYTIFTSDNNNCVTLFEWLDSVRVIDLTLYPDDTKKVIVSLILDLFYAEMRQLGKSQQLDGYRELRAMIMVDEAHQFLGKDFDSLRNIISEGRMFGVGMILSTQNVSDFKTAKEDYSQFILSWIIHHVNNISKFEAASIFGASDTNVDRYIDFINKAQLFESVCKIGHRVEAIRDLPYFELIDKDPRFE